MDKGVITGDVVKSTLIPMNERVALLETLNSVFASMAQVCAFKHEIFRGDSLQLIVEKPSDTLLVAMLLRSGLKGETPASMKIPWDIRLSIGIGKVEFVGNGLGISDGEAFRLSGRGLDSMGKERLCAITPWDDINGELSATVPYMDDIATNWTISQSKAVFAALKGEKTLAEIGGDLGQSHQNVSKLLITAKFGLIRNSLERFSEIINAKIQ